MNEEENYNVISEKFDEAFLVVMDNLLELSSDNKEWILPICMNTAGELIFKVANVISTQEDEYDKSLFMLLLKNLIKQLQELEKDFEMENKKH